eukprot:snap_masked-scaffold_1-processed-gene-2.18-mRNA-1 protein AED:0.32 eAED:0.32 QI:0/-1/0/1/-1/1/1/0/438
METEAASTSLPKTIPTQRNLTLLERMVSASFGAFLTSLLVTPLDVVKTRLQTQTSNPKLNNFSHMSYSTVKQKLSSQNFSFKDPLRCPSCTHYIFSNGLMEHTIPKSILFSHCSNTQFNSPSTVKSPPRNFSKFSSGSLTVKKSSPNLFFQRSILSPTVSRSIPIVAYESKVIEFNGTFDGLRKILNKEGLSGLYLGLKPTLFMAIPATVLYFAAYDYLSIYLQKQGSKFGKNEEFQTASIALLSGSSARVFASTIVSPIELVRTKLQATNLAHQNISSAENTKIVLKELRKDIKSSSILTLWRGLLPTLLRDVPFSAVYWVCVELTKKELRKRGYKETKRDEIYVSLVSGSVSGMVAAFLTTPFDVIKTRRQVFEFSKQSGTKESSSKLSHILQTIIKKEGVKGLFAGLLPRVAKVAPSCGIMLSSYEAGKQFFIRT